MRSRSDGTPASCGVAGERRGAGAAAVARGDGGPEGIPLLRAPREGQDIVADYGSTGLTLRRHPLACCGRSSSRRGVIPTQELWELPNGRNG